MSSLFKKCVKGNIINSNSYPSFILNSIQYETIMGSHAYGVNNKDSDIDIYGFCIPPIDYIFPYRNTKYILNFGKKPVSFEQYQVTGLKHPDDQTKDVDFQIFNIVKYFDLLMGNNPNVLDSLFTPDRCVINISQIGKYVRENRRKFLNKKAWHTYKGYSYSQVKKLRTKTPISKRYDDFEKYGYDLKFAYHVVRLLNQIEQILLEEDLDLERNNEQLKSIRRGEWTIEFIVVYFNLKESELESLYIKSKLPHGPDEDCIKNILLNCLEMYYGSLDNMIKTEESDRVNNILSDFEQVLYKHKKGK